MAKREESVDTEDMEPVQEAAAPAGAEFVSERSSNPKSDSYTTMLILAFVAFAAGAWVSGREAWEHYDVQFGMFEKRPVSSGAAAETAPAEVATPVPGEVAPVPATPPPADPK